jgi:hypothetical protein
MKTSLISSSSFFVHGTPSGLLMAGDRVGGKKITINQKLKAAVEKVATTAVAEAAEDNNGKPESDMYDRQTITRYVHNGQWMEILCTKTNHKS